jgi:hypothetical protein
MRHTVGQAYIRTERMNGQHRKIRCFRRILKLLIDMGTPPALVLFHYLVVFRLHLVVCKEIDAGGIRLKEGFFRRHCFIPSFI